jgi:translation initiation factor IF-2
VRFVGVDLAWGGRRPSGLAVLDEGGRVVGEGWATTDGELSGFLAGHDRGGAVALDAPLVVGNPAGPGGPARGSCRGGTGGSEPGRTRPTWAPRGAGADDGAGAPVGPAVRDRAPRPGTGARVVGGRGVSGAGAGGAGRAGPGGALQEGAARGPPGGAGGGGGDPRGAGRGRPAAAARPGGGPGPGAGPAGPAAGGGAEGGRGPGRRPCLRLCGAVVVGPRAGRDPGRGGRRHRGHPGAPAGR